MQKYIAKKILDEAGNSEPGYSLKNSSLSFMKFLSVLILLLFVGKYGCDDTNLSIAKSSIKLETTPDSPAMDKVYMELGKHFDYVYLTVENEFKRKFENERFKKEYQEMIVSYFGTQDNPANLGGFNWTYDENIEFTHKGKGLILKSFVIHVKKNQHGYVGYNVTRSMSEFVFSYDGAPGNVRAKKDSDSLIGRSFFPDSVLVKRLMNQKKEWSGDHKKEEVYTLEKEV